MTMAVPMKVLVVDDEAAMRHMLRLVLERAGYAVAEADGGAAALTLLEREVVPLVLCDVRMPEMDGLALLERLLQLQPSATVIMMSAYGTVDSAIACMQKGAYDYIAKPFKPDEVVLTLRKATERLGLQAENRQLKQLLRQDPDGQGVVAASPAMQAVLALARRAAASPVPVLITGETGTGKEVIARELHRHSPRAGGPFVAVNCGAITGTLIERELFGHVRGAFTGAERDSDGLFVAAHGGTLFLDEIAELPLELQPNLLRAVQEGEIRRVGDVRSRKVDVRLLAATSRDLRQEVAAGRFREDLFYRLNVVEIHLPPLRERLADIPPLVEHFARGFAHRAGRPAPVFEPELLRRLQARSWPGNAREVQNFVEKLLLFHDGGRVTQADLPAATGADDLETEGLSLKLAIERLERDHIRRALQVTGGNRTRAAELLEISLRSLHYKLKEYGLD